MKKNFLFIPFILLFGNNLAHSQQIPNDTIQIVELFAQELNVKSLIKNEFTRSVPESSFILIDRLNVKPEPSPPSLEVRSLEIKRRRAWINAVYLPSETALLNIRFKKKSNKWVISKVNVTSIN